MRHEVRVLLVTSVLVTLVVASASGCSLLFEGSPNLNDAATEVDASEVDAAPDANTSDAGPGDLVHDLDMGPTTEVGGSGVGGYPFDFDCPGGGVVLAVRAKPWTALAGLCGFKVQCGYLEVLDSGEVRRTSGGWIPEKATLGDHASCLLANSMELSCPGDSIVAGITVTVPTPPSIGSLRLTCTSMTGHGEYAGALTITNEIGAVGTSSTSTACPEPSVMTGVAGETWVASMQQGTLIKNLALGCHTLKHQ